MSSLAAPTVQTLRRTDRALERLRRMKLRTLAAVLVGVLAAFLLSYTVHFGPFRVAPRVRPFGVAQTQLLVDSDPSPLADIYVFTEANGNLALNLAEIANSPQIRAAAARAVGQSQSAIGVTEQINENVAYAASNAEEAQAGSTILDDARRYSVFLRVDSGSFVIQIFTQAPSGVQAIRMANGVAHALQGFTVKLVSAEAVRGGRVILRQIFPAYGGDVDRNIAIEACVALALVFVMIGLAILLSVTALRERRAFVTADLSDPA